MPALRFDKCVYKSFLAIRLWLKCPIKVLSGLIYSHIQDVPFVNEG